MHVTHRGVNRGAVFIDDVDHARYLELLSEALAERQIALHAYVLMTNHVHLLVTPERTGALSTALVDTGRRYVPEFNRRYARTGTLWEGRYKSCLIGSANYILAVYRYIDLNPVRAAMVAKAEDYRWSSARANLGLDGTRLVTPHRTLTGYLRDVSAADERDGYRSWLDAGIRDNELAMLRNYVRQERVYGSERFQEMVAKTLGRPSVWRPRGRPATGTA
jgi:putative transposase